MDKMDIRQLARKCGAGVMPAVALFGTRIELTTVRDMIWYTYIELENMLG